MLNIFYDVGELIRQNPGSVMVYVVVYGIFSAWLAFETSRHIGYGPVWFALFFFLPIVSHVLWVAVILMVVLRRRRDYFERKSIFDISRAAGKEEGATSEEPEEHSVTPFSGNPASSHQIAEIECFTIPPHLRDKKLDELIEFEQWLHALNYTEKKINEAQENHREGMERIYREYERMIRVRNRTLKIEDDVFPEIWTGGSNTDQS